MFCLVLGAKYWCVYLCLQIALKERGIDRMLEEAREDNKENDAANMKRKCKKTPGCPFGKNSNTTPE
jgi:hypothetical protein